MNPTHNVVISRGPVVQFADETTGVLPVSSDRTTFTQTYSTTSTTIATLTYADPAAITSHAITDSSGGTPSTSELAAQAVTVTGVDGTGSNAASKADVEALLVILRNNIATVNAELTLVKADLAAARTKLIALGADALAMKKNDNAIVDVLQQFGNAL